MDTMLRSDANVIFARLVSKSVLLLVLSGSLAGCGNAISHLGCDWDLSEMTRVEDGRYSYASSYPEEYKAYFVEFIDGPYVVPTELYQFEYTETIEPDIEVGHYKTRVPPAMEELQLLVLRRTEYDGSVTIVGSDDLGILFACS